MKFYKQLEQEKNNIESRIMEREAFVSNAPEGKLRCYKNGKNVRWYHITLETDKDGNHVKKRKYLPKCELEKAKTLVKKELYENELKDDKQELRSINMYLHNCSKYDRGRKFIEGTEEYSRLLGELYNLKQKDKSSKVMNWIEDKYIGGVPHPEELNVPTRAGFNVRSKSERDIIRVLMEHDIPFKYEQKLVYDGQNLYPDFTILSPVTGKEILWEHNGLMDKPWYVEKKLKDELLYYKLGYRRGKNMIVTYEENNEGIDELWIDRIIHHFILQDE